MEEPGLSNEIKRDLFNSLLHGSEDNKAQWADDWFRNLKTVVHPVINEKRPDGQKRVRIAILDTGIDGSHPEIMAALSKRKIADYVGFPDSLDPLQDKHGHGTHGVSVLMKTAPESVIYVARIFDDGGQIPRDDDYKETTRAIQWAVRNSVDIISISWGMDEDSHSIATALDNAKEHGVVIMASASNEGANFPITFPARMRNTVFCTGSADGKGFPSPFNPPFMGEEKYSALGEAVMGANPTNAVRSSHNEFGELYVRRDGTSTATQVAAGIAALLIDFIRQLMVLAPGNSNYTNIRNLFIKMSEATVQQSYRYLAPWYLFGAGRDSRTLVKDILTTPAALDKTWYPHSRLASISAEHPILVFPETTEPSPKYVERESATLLRVRRALRSQHRVAITGLPGIGKTELARQFVKSSCEKEHTYKGIFWIPCEKETSLHVALYDVAKELGLRVQADTGVSDVFKMVLRELNAQDYWLMVLDNVSDVRFIKNWLPERKGFRHVLITSRFSEVYQRLVAEHIHLDAMTKDEARRLFFASYRGQETGTLRFQDGTDDVSVLMNELGNLPLAIIQAVAYLHETCDSVASYTKIYRESRQDIWEWYPTQDTSYVSVATAVRVSFGMLKQSETGIRVFSLMSFLDPDNIPELLWTTDPRLRDLKLRETFSNSAKLNKALQPLLAYSFIQRSITSGSISIHRLVQDVMRDLIHSNAKDERGLLETLEPEARHPAYWIERAIEAVAIAYPITKFQNFRKCEVLKPHAYACIEHGLKHGIVTEEFWVLLDSVGLYMHDTGDYNASAQLDLMAAMISQTAFGTDDIRTSVANFNLGLDLQKQKKHVEAIPTVQRALKVFEKELGPCHIRNMAAYLTLGVSCRALERFSEAREYYERAVVICESVGDNLRKAWVLGFIGNLYLSQRKVDEALVTYEKAVRIFETEPDEPELSIYFAAILHNLAVVLETQGQYAKATRRIERSVELSERVFGVGHIQTARMVMILGNLLSSQGRHAEAIQQYKKITSLADTAMPIDKRLDAIQLLSCGVQSKQNEEIYYDGTLPVLGSVEVEYDIQIADLKNRLGIVYKNAGRYDEAITQYQEVLRIEGVDDTDSLKALSNLGNVYCKMGKFDEALNTFTQALQMSEKLLGPDHFNTAVVLVNLAGAYIGLNRYGSAEMSSQSALQILQNEYGVGHIQTADVIYNLGVIYRDQGKIDEAIVHYDRAWTIRKSAGIEDEKTAVILTGLGFLLTKRGKHNEAITKQKHALALWEKLPETNNKEVGLTYMRLGLAYILSAEQLMPAERSRRLNSAIRSLRRAHRILHQELGDEDADTATTKMILEEVEKSVVPVVVVSKYPTIHSAIYSGSRSGVKKFIDLNEDLSSRDENGDTPLHLATATANLHLVGMLADADADVLAKGHLGMTALHMAVSAPEPDIEIVRILLDAGSDISARDSRDRSVLHAAVRPIDRPVQAFVMNDEIRTPVNDLRAVYVAEHSSIKVCRLLLEHPTADVGLQDALGCTALHLAAAMGNTEMVRMLLKSRADPSARDRDGNSPLHLTLSSQPVDLDIARALLKAGANLQAESFLGQTPLDLAGRLKDPEGRQRQFELRLEADGKWSIWEAESGKTPDELANISMSRDDSEGGVLAYMFI